MSLSESASTDSDPIIGASREIQSVLNLIQQVAPSPMSVCILGESGTGKELVAQAIHRQSARPGPFTAINCGAIPANLIESEFFGHEAGAFTGTRGQHRGIFEQADGGTLFLDEIGEMPLDLQTRLLRVLETRRIRRIGGSREIPTNVRILSATHHDLTQSVGEGKFRADLFYRLYLFPIHLPPLRQRRTDVPMLARYFLQKYSQGMKAFSDGALKKLEEHPWPGNVRELENTIRRAAFLAGSPVIGESEIPLLPAAPSEQLPPLTWKDHERQTILAALQQCRGNRVQAAHLLQIARSTLINKIKRLGIEVD